MTNFALYCLFIALIAASIVWCGGVIARVADTRIKRCFTLISLGVCLLAIINMTKIAINAVGVTKTILNCLYVIPALMIIIPMIVGAVMLIKASKGEKFPNAPLILIAITVIYALFYALKVPVFVSSPITIIGGALIIMICESCITPKTIRTGSDFRKVFVKSPLPVAIADKEKEIVISTESAAPDKVAIEKAIENGGEFKKDENTIMTTSKFSGGYIAFSTDIKELNMLVDELTETSQQLQKNSELISMESEIRQELTAAKTLNQLYDEGVAIATKKLAIISNILSALPENDEKARERMLLRAQIIAAYLRSKFAMLSFIEQNGALYTRNLFDSITEIIETTDKTIEDCSVEFSHLKEIDNRIAMLIFDWAENLCEFALTFGSPTLRITMDEEHGKIVLLALLSGVDTHKKFEINKELLRKIALLGGKTGIDVSTDSIALRVILPTEVL
ncbi:MAG: hypothetical protein IKU25_08135 [Clostridia bacterium]|nr:hypothetical protein [Clostridia bacterium]